jgi:hypothetical protein
MSFIEFIISSAGTTDSMSSVQASSIVTAKSGTWKVFRLQERGLVSTINIFHSRTLKKCIICLTLTHSLLLLKKRIRSFMLAEPRFGLFSSLCAGPNFHLTGRLNYNAKGHTNFLLCTSRSQYHLVSSISPGHGREGSWPN